jgi:regulator of replication initiation timing
MDSMRDSPERELERDIAMLEQKLATLLAHTRALRVANEALRRELAAANARNQALAARVATARERLDALLARMPAAIE